MIRPLTDAEKAANWAACRKAAHRFFLILFIGPALALFTLIGYTKGRLDEHTAQCPAEIISRKEPTQ